MKIALLGYGKMGRMVEQAAAREGIEVVCIVDPVAGSRGSLSDCEVAIDFTTPDTVIDNVRLAASAKVAMVVGTTGWYARLDEARSLVEQAGIGLVYGSNFSIGVNLMFRVSRYAAELFSRFDAYDPFVEEAHHRFKKDAPSGTAIFLKRDLDALYHRDVTVASTRAGHIPGTHTVGFDSEADTLTITHTARSRAGFAEGALAAARWIRGKQGFFEFSTVIDQQLRIS
ncbi:MAG TPA: dihydrodipicolinate reductase C-terminal domain-containing protein [Blastocatellia bacterium]|nr:dihydrodipicolinate reductase C-terminal domain-containing protein [Blastocatellia bacterium]